MANPFQNTQQVNAVIRIRRGYDNERLSNTYDSGELIYTVDKKRVFVGDGKGSTSTTGGILVGNKVWVTDNFLKLDQIQKNDLVYRTDSGYTGFYLLTGNNYQEDNSYVVLVDFNLQGSQYSLTPATRNVLGGVKIKNGLSVDTDGSVSVELDTTTLELSNNKIKVKNPYTGQNTGGGNISYASYNDYGIVKVSPTSGVLINNGVLGVNLDNKTIKLSSTIEGSKLYVDSSNINFPSLPIASSVTLGGIKLGDGLSANGSGVVNVKVATDSDFGGLILGDGLSANPNTGKVDVTYSNFGTALLSSKGYQTFPSGLIMQWGDLPTTNGNQINASVTFAIPFPNSVVSFNITANTNNRPANQLNVWSVYNYTLSGFVARTQDNDSTPYEGWWVAMGY